IETVAVRIKGREPELLLCQPFQPSQATTNEFEFNVSKHNQSQQADIQRTLSNHSKLQPMNLAQTRPFASKSTK
ncbi:3618_t:CDS:1, partial [Ambispora leptoticha]